MPKYKLTYFNAKGFAELARMVFAQAGVDYEDERFEREEWPKFQPNTPFGQAPVLKVDGAQIADSAVIARYLAKEYGMAGKGKLQEAQVDMYAAAAYDLVKPIGAIFNAKGAEQEELKKKFGSETAPKFLQGFEKALSGNKSGFLVGDTVTWADFALAHFLSFLAGMLPAEVLSPYPKVLAHQKKVEALPKIAAWIKKRPVTQT